MKTITGQQLTELRPIGSLYHNDCINVSDDKENHYLMKVKEVMKFDKPFNEMVFNIVKKIRHNYLEVKK